ncbi:hypothetical protein DESC_460138 [Desulfosarcina cetonica]|nr:hypothetical protein DESC_460138 [Desulfosarcina cetonica]
MAFFIWSLTFMDALFLGRKATRKSICDCPEGERRMVILRQPITPSKNTILTSIDKSKSAQILNPGQVVEGKNFIRQAAFLQVGENHDRAIPLIQRAVGFHHRRAPDTIADIFDLLEMQGLDEHSRGREAINARGHPFILQHPHLQPVIGDRAGLGFQLQQMLALIFLKGRDVVLDTVVQPHDVGVVEDAAHNRLHAGDADRPAHIGNVEPHVVAQAQGGASRFTGRRDKQGHDLVLVLFEEPEHELLPAAVRFDVDDLAVHFKVVRLEVLVHLGKDLGTAQRFPPGGTGQHAEHQDHRRVQGYFHWKLLFAKSDMVAS